MIVTVFRSRLRPENIDEYHALAEEMSALARSMPGYIAHRGYTAEDGERITIVEFESEETHRAWAEHPAHRRAQQQGRQRFYSEYAIQVCKLLRANAFRKPA